MSRFGTSQSRRPLKLFRLLNSLRQILRLWSTHTGLRTFTKLQRCFRTLSQTLVGWCLVCRTLSLGSWLAGCLFIALPPRRALPHPHVAATAPAQRQAASKMQNAILIYEGTITIRGTQPSRVVPLRSQPQQPQPRCKQAKCNRVKYTAPGLPALSACPPPSLPHDMRYVRQPHDTAPAQTKGW